MTQHFNGDGTVDRRYKKEKPLTNEQRALAERYRTVAEARARKFVAKWGGRINEEDARGIAYIGLCRAVQSWDPDRGPIELHIWQLVGQRLIDGPLASDLTGARCGFIQRRPLLNHVRLDDPNTHLTLRARDEHSEVPIDLSTLIKKAKLSERQYDAVRAWAMGPGSSGFFASIRGISSTRLNQIFDNGLTKLRRAARVRIERKRS